MSPHRPRPQRPHPRPPETRIPPPSSAPPLPAARDPDSSRRCHRGGCLPVLLSTLSYSHHCPNLPSALDLPGGEGSALGSVARVPVPEVSTGYFIGGDRIFGPDPSSQSCSFSLLPSSIARTTSASLLHISATLTVSSGCLPFHDRGGQNLFEYDSRARHFRPWLPRFTGRRSSITFGLEGYYSTASVDLCMVGIGSGSASPTTSARGADAAQFRVRAADICTSYKVCQLRAGFVKDDGEREAMWEKQHELGAQKMYSLCSELGRLFLKHKNFLAEKMVVRTVSIL